MIETSFSVPAVNSRVTAIRAKLRRGEKVNVLVMESTTNTSKVSLLSALSRLDYNVFVLSHENSVIAKRLYASLGATVVYGGALSSVVDHNDIDIVFIDNPHYYFDCMAPSHDFYRKLESSLYERVLFCYVPYAYISVSSGEAYTDVFHRFSWKFFLESNFHLLEYLRYTNNTVRLDNGVVTGHPYLDPYFTSKYDVIDEFDLRRTGGKVVVWCPHHNPVFYSQISLWDQAMALQLLLERDPSVTVVFRPHPNLFATLSSKVHQQSKDYQTLMSGNSLGEFQEFWFNHPRVLRIERGPIYQVFKSANVVLHNCGGYQMEAVLSGARVVNTINRDLLSSHMMQFEGAQSFPSDLASLKQGLERAVDSERLFDYGELAGKQGIEAGELIARNIAVSLE